MIGEFIDRAIEPFFPSWAYRRRYFRQNMQLVRSRADAGRLAARRSYDRRGSIDKTRTLGDDRALARTLYRENPYGRGVINSIVANLVGMGIRPLPKVARPRLDVPDEDTNDRLSELWAEWARHATVRRRRSFYWLQRRLMREYWITGEAILHISSVRDGRKVPLGVELIASERLADDMDMFRSRRGSNEVIQGVEFDGNDVPVAYHIYPRHPSQSDILRPDPVRVPASQIIHYYDPTEPEQVRGETRFLAVSNTLDSMDQWLDFVLAKERSAAAFVGMIRKDFGSVATHGFSTGDSDDDTDDNSNELDAIEGGMLLHGRPGEDLKAISSGVVGSQVDHLAMMFLRQVARGFDVSYELLSRDLSNVTYLSARQGENQDRRHWEPEQEEFSNALIEPIYNEFVRLAVSSGLVRGASPENLERFCTCDFIRPGWDWIDPDKDIAGDIESIKAGIESPIRVMQKRGKDPWRILEEIELFKGWAEEKGLTLSVINDNPIELANAEAKAAAAAAPAPAPATNGATNGQKAAPARS